MVPFPAFLFLRLIVKALLASCVDRVCMEHPLKQCYRSECVSRRTFGNEPQRSILNGPKPSVCKVLLFLQFTTSERKIGLLLIDICATLKDKSKWPLGNGWPFVVCQVYNEYYLIKL